MTERPGIPHNVVGHTLMCVPGLRLVGWWVHGRTEPMVPTWRARWRAFRRDERAGRL